jgi:hypothetical protein
MEHLTDTVFKFRQNLKEHVSRMEWEKLSQKIVIVNDEVIKNKAIQFRGKRIKIE